MKFPSFVSLIFALLLIATIVRIGWGFVKWSF